MNRIYDALPFTLKNLAISAAGALKSRKKYGSLFHCHLKFLLESTTSEKTEYATRQLSSFLAEVRNSESIYEIPSSHNLNDIPIITKDEVLANYDRIVRERPFAAVRSSGTTGQPLRVAYNMKAYQHEYSYWWYHRSYRGIRRGDRIATFAGHKVAYINRHTPPYWAYNYSENQLLFSSYHMSTESLPLYIAELNRFQPRLIHGYPSSIYLVAKRILDDANALRFRPKMIITASETLLSFQRKTIEKAFQTKAYNWYGNTELCGHATECEFGRIHTQPTHSAIRIVDAAGINVAPGQEGTIIATSFSNTCMPLINYNTGDRATVSTQQHCECGRGGILLDNISGRIEDYIYTADGRLIGRLDHLLKDAKHVSNAQLIQDRIGKIIIRIEREPLYNRVIEDGIRAEALKRLGSNTKITFDYSTPIKKNTNGKFRFIVQNANRPS